MKVIIYKNVALPERKMVVKANIRIMAKDLYGWERETQLETDHPAVDDYRFDELGHMEISPELYEAITGGLVREGVS